MPSRPKIKMPNSERAKQFAAFKALSGLDEAFEKKRRELGYEERKILSEDEENELNGIICSMEKGQRIEIRFYNGRAYETGAFTVTGIDEFEKLLCTENRNIRFGDIAEIVPLYTAENKEGN